MIADEVVKRIQTYVSLRSPTSRNVRSFVDWMQDHKPLTKEESTFLEHKDDFVALSDGQENGWLDGVVEDTLNFCLPKNLMKVCLTFNLSLLHIKLLYPSELSQKLFTSSSLSNRTDDDHLRLCSKRRIDMVVRLVLVVTTVALLVGPSAVLFLVEGQSSLKICLILLFTLLFAAALSVCTKAKRHEMLAAAAT